MARATRTAGDSRWLSLRQKQEILPRNAAKHVRSTVGSDTIEGCHALHLSGSGPGVLLVKFRHDAIIDRYFPKIEPTCKQVEIAALIIIKFRADKVYHEHLYLDQGSALEQIGALDAGDLPIAGPEATRKVLDATQPSNIFMQDAWAEREGTPL